MNYRHFSLEFCASLRISTLAETYERVTSFFINFTLLLCDPEFTISLLATVSLAAILYSVKAHIHLNIAGTHLHSDPVERLFLFSAALESSVSCGKLPTPIINCMKWLRNSWWKERGMRMRGKVNSVLAFSVFSAQMRMCANQWNSKILFIMKDGKCKKK